VPSARVSVAHQGAVSSASVQALWVAPLYAKGNRQAQAPPPRALAQGGCQKPRASSGTGWAPVLVRIVKSMATPIFSGKVPTIRTSSGVAAGLRRAGPGISKFETRPPL
jgi:hypothetical protein